MSLYRTREGTGPDLVLLHGFGLHSGVWDLVRPTLARDWTTWCVDLPGHGQSPWEPGLDGLDALAARIAAVLPPDAMLLGWSLGGQLAIRLAERYPERVSGLVLVATTPRFVIGDGWPHGVAQPLLEEFRERLDDDFRGLLRDFLTLQVRGDEHAVAALRHLRGTLFRHGAPAPAALALGLTVLATVDLRTTLPGVHQPALVISGERDRLTPPAAGRYLADALPDARYLELARCGHAPFLSHPRAFIEGLERHADMRRRVGSQPA
jgi:pimeloyl-[acyl-carrier protein] methyl ester esterase